jgi:hypothetical protein
MRATIIILDNGYTFAEVAEDDERSWTTVVRFPGGSLLLPGRGEDVDEDGMESFCEVLNRGNWYALRKPSRPLLLAVAARGSACNPTCC